MQYFSNSILINFEKLSRKFYAKLDEIQVLLQFSCPKKTNEGRKQPFCSLKTVNQLFRIDQTLNDRMQEAITGQDAALVQAEGAPIGT